MKDTTQANEVAVPERAHEHVRFLQGLVEEARLARGEYVRGLHDGQELEGDWSLNTKRMVWERVSDPPLNGHKE